MFSGHWPRPSAMFGSSLGDLALRRVWNHRTHRLRMSSTSLRSMPFASLTYTLHSFTTIDDDRFFPYLSLTTDGHQHRRVLGYHINLLKCYHPACGHEGSSHLSPVLDLRFFYRDAGIGRRNSVDTSRLNI